jgi:hypothetical protein
LGCDAKIFGAASIRYLLPFEGISRVMVPTAMVSGAMPIAWRAAAISSALRARANSSSGAPRYTTLVRSAGINRARVVNSPVDSETAIARSV